jgi:hypothetical protein
MFLGLPSFIPEHRQNVYAVYPKCCADVRNIWLGNYARCAFASDDLQPSRLGKTNYERIAGRSILAGVYQPRMGSKNSRDALLYFRIEGNDHRATRLQPLESCIVFFLKFPVDLIDRKNNSIPRGRLHLSPNRRNTSGG